MRTAMLAQRSWRSHLRAVLAIARKDVLHFARYPLNALFQVLQPIAWLTPIYFLGRTFATTEGNPGFAAYTGTSDYMSFVLIGALLTSYVSAVFWGMGFSLKRDMDAGVMESNWMAPVPRGLFLLGQTLANLAIITLTNAALLGLATLLFGFNTTGNLLAAALTLLPVLVALYGFGFAFAAVVLLMRDANMLVDVANFLVAMLSGSQFPVQVLPRWLLPLSLALPLTYGYDALRGLLLGSATLLPLEYELMIVVGFMFVMLPLGYVVFSRVERRCRRHGTIGMH